MKTLDSRSSEKRRYLFILTSLIPIMLLVFALVFASVQEANAAGVLEVNVIVAPNLVVDSNVLSPSTYAPKVATVIGEFCNTGDTALTDVTGYIGDGAIPGTYPSSGPNFEPGSTTYDGPLAFSHLGGTPDATRYMGTLAPGKCLYQYWSFEYPQTALSGGVEIPTWGKSVKAEDDLYLNFNIWGTSNLGAATTSPAATTMYFRNEISAMANKIRPNGNPSGEWFNTNTSTVYPGQTITTNGVLYRIGNVNQGFDNDKDGSPDYNAWLQPFGDPAYDPSCFRLIGSSGTLTVTRSAGNPDLIIDFTDQLYFTGIPADNTDVRGVVYYEFLALGGACTIPISPYQEVASGRDNEKFNGDFGTGVPALMTYEPEVELTKTAPGTVSEGATINYSIGFINTGSAEAGITLSSGGVNAGLMISDTVPTGLTYVGGTAAAGNTEPGGGNTFSIRYSTDSGVTWSTTDPGDTSSTASNRVIIQWWLDEPLDVSGSGNNTGVVTYSASVPGTYIGDGGDPFIENCATSHFGDAAPFAESCATTLVNGTYSIGDRVWRDDNANGTQDAGEAHIDGVLMSLYWDKNGDGKLDDGDVLVSTQETSNIDADSNYIFNNLPSGDYLVAVNTTDDSIPSGYAPTTPKIHAVPNLSGNYIAADFGFGPVLDIQKNLRSLDPAYVGEDIIFTIDLNNTLPGDGTSAGNCVYTLWNNNATTGSPPKDFQAVTNGEGAIDGAYTIGDYSTGSNQAIDGTGFSSSGRTSNILQVDAIAYGYFDQTIDDDQLALMLIDGVTSPEPERLYTTSELNQLAPGINQIGFLKWTNISATPALGGSWDWTDFDNPALALRLEMRKDGGADDGLLYLDAFGYRITTDDTTCGGADTTIATLPVEDTYDADLMQFVSSDPAVSSSTTGGTEPNDGTLTWDNLGPLYAGGTRTVTVTFKALATTSAANNVNTALVDSAKFGNGRDTNDDSDTADVAILASGSIAGNVWAEDGTSGPWSGSTGYDGADTHMPNVAVNLYTCVDSATQIPFNPANSEPVGNPNKDCANYGEWKLVGSALTDANGDYLFDGLRNGFYNVIVDDSTVVAGFTSHTATANPDANGLGSSCTTSTCNEWNSPTANLTTFNSLDSSSGSEDIKDVSFGYDNPAGNGAVTGYVWRDSNSDGVFDSAELGIPGVPVYLCLLTTIPCDETNHDATINTDANGFYQFTNTPDDYVIVVDQPSGTTQTGDPDVSSPPACSGVACDNTKASFPIVEDEVAGNYNFGYVGTLSIGDTVYRDWNGDGIEDAGEEGINGVQVELYLDTNRDGILDSGDTLLETQTTANDGSNDGRYSFDNLPGGGTRYLVKVNGSTVPAGHQLTADPSEPNVTCTICYGIYSATLQDDDIEIADFGYQPQGYGSIGDLVWTDLNANGIQDGNESGIPNAAITLYQDQNGNGIIDPEDAVVAQTTTGANGDYLFSNLAKGDYIVQVDDANFNAGQSLAGLTQTNDTKDGLHKVDLDDAEHYELADFGYTSSSIGDFVWQDNNGDGLNDAGEPGIPGVTVYLCAAGAVTCDSDNNIASTITDGSGLYLFSGLAPGNYQVVVDTSSPVLANYTLTGDPDAYNTDNTDPDISCLNVNMVGCDSTYTLDSYTAPDGTVFFGLQLGQNNMSADFGYQPQGVVGDTLWVDTNDNGVQDAGEAGLGGVDVWLCTTTPCNASTPGVIATTTDATGYYSFGNLSDATIYYIAVDETDLPSNISQTFDAADGTSCTERLVTDAPSGGDCLPVISVLTDFSRLAGTGSIASIGGNACAANCEMDVDFGYRYTGTNLINGTVWYDTDEQGDIDGDEPVRYEDVVIYLYDCGVDTICGTEDDVQVASTLTAADGTYSFPDLANGKYRVAMNIDSPSINGLKKTTQTVYDDIVLSGGTTETRNFGVVGVIDLGDLPTWYGVTAFSENGARHTLSDRRLLLGNNVDADPQGQPQNEAGATANGDDFDDDNPLGAGIDDEDGVEVRPGAANPAHGGWTEGTVASDNGGSLLITISSEYGWSGVPQLFMDFNETNSLTEVTLRDVDGNPISGPLPPEPHRVYFDIPTGTFPGGTATNPIFARVRLSQAGGLSVTGDGGIGEVEDYRWEFGPTAVSLSSFNANNNIAIPVGLVIGLSFILAAGSFIIIRRRKVME